jgi:hypothetical protein
MAAIAAARCSTLSAVDWGIDRGLAIDKSSNVWLISACERLGA